MVDNGLPTSQLWAGAWLLGISSVVAWIFLAQHMDGSGSWDSAAICALAIGVVGAMFSACCALSVAIKSSEARIRRGRTAVDVHDGPYPKPNDHSCRCPGASMPLVQRQLVGTRAAD